MPRKPPNPAAALARLRWAKPDADREQPRKAGKLGGRKPTCLCGECAKCLRRAARSAERRAERESKNVAMAPLKGKANGDMCVAL